MSAATKLLQKYKATRYPLYFEPLDITLYIQPLTVGQRQASQKVKLIDKQHTYVFSIAVYDEAGDLFADSQKEVEDLPESLVGLCVATIFQLTNGASHQTCDKVVEHFLRSVNITDEDELAILEAEDKELNETIEQETSIKNG